MPENKYREQFKELGNRYRNLRRQRNMVQEDVIEYGFSVRHYQQLEAGRPHSLSTLLRLADMFGVSPDRLLKGLPGAAGERMNPPLEKSTARKKRPARPGAGRR